MDSLKAQLAELAATDTSDLSLDLKAFVLALPDLLAHARLFSEAPNTPPEARKLYGYLLTYVYHSLDFLPEEDLGFCGYLDDAYLAGRVAQHLQPDLNWPLGGQLPDWLALSRQAIPHVTTRLDALFEDLLNGDTVAFHVAIVSREH